MDFRYIYTSGSSQSSGDGGQKYKKKTSRGWHGVDVIIEMQEGTSKGPREALPHSDS